MTNLYGSCEDCTDGLCSMNCSSAVLVTTAEHIAHDMRMGRFPARSSPTMFLAEKATTAIEPNSVGTPQGVNQK